MNINPNYFTNLPAICFILFTFGVAFNWLTSWMHRRGYSDGYTWVLVVVGVAVTIGASGLVLGWTAVWVLFVLFACSGLPMAAGDIWRHVQAQREFVHYRSKRSGNEETP